MKIVVCGSYGDMESFIELLQHIRTQYKSADVFPDELHLKKSNPCIIAHHISHIENDETITLRSKLMGVYFDRIEDADIIIVKNDKNGKEYYGVGTTIELGYAVANRKTIYFTKQPTNPNICSLLKKPPKKSVLKVLL